MKCSDWRRRTILISGLAIVVLVILPGSRADDEGPDPRAEMERIEALMGEGDWKAADKALKLYGRRFAKTDEERAEVEKLRSLAKGQMKLADIQKKYRKKEHHRKTANELTELLEDYGQHEDVRAKAEELLQAARSVYVLVIEDFEESKDDETLEGSEDNSRGRFIVTDLKRVKQGRR